MANVVVICPSCGYQQVMSLVSLRIYRCGYCRTEFPSYILFDGNFVRTATKEVIEKSKSRQLVRAIG
jgi:ribosomal protein L37AE/L43A